MAILLTGAAGFIGYHTALRLLDRGEEVIGIDNLNDYYDPRLKEARLAQLRKRNNFSFHRADIADRAAMGAIAAAAPDVDQIIHLAAQAGVRYSLINPQAYIDSNVTGQLVMLELARKLNRLRHFVYASSSSVYGANTKLPFSADDPVDKPVSLYAATKRAGELLSLQPQPALSTAGDRAAVLHGVRSLGPAGHVAVHLHQGDPGGRADPRLQQRRDETRLHLYRRHRRRRRRGARSSACCHPDGEPPHRLYNLGNHRCEPLMRFIEVIEKNCGKKAKLDLQPMQPGDVRETFADIESSTRDLGFSPKTSIDEGVPRFVAWYRDYHGV